MQIIEFFPHESQTPQQPKHNANPPSWLQALWTQHHKTITLIIIIYITLVRLLRYHRKQTIERPITHGGRKLSSMTSQEAHAIITQLQELEFPYAF